MSFYAIDDDDNSIENVTSTLDMALDIIGEGEASQHLPNGLWVGSLQSISPTSGYWLILDDEEPIIINHRYKIQKTTSSKRSLRLQKLCKM